MSDTGYYCANTIWVVDSDKDKLANEVAVAFWSKNPGPKDFPGPMLHIPYWSKKPMHGISCDLVNDVFIASEAAMQSTAGGGAASAGEDGDKGHGKDGKEKGKGGHGGWLPRTAALVAAYESQDWEEVERLCTSYKKMSYPLAQLVEGKRKRRRTR